MIGDQIDRITVDNDEATFNSCIRTVRPPSEEWFLDLCLQRRLSSVSKLKGISHASPGLYTVFSTSVGGKVFDSFRKKARELQSYTDDTCCSKILKQGTGLEDLFHHFESEALQHAPPQAKTRGLESARTIRLLHDKFKSDVSTFDWEKRMKTPPDECPEPLCARYMPEDDRKSDTWPLYGFGTELPHEAMRITPNLSLSRIFNILWLLPHFYPGIQSSYTYLAETHSYFAIHCEDSNLWGLNYMYLGHPKIWIIIPPDSASWLELNLKRDSPISDAKCLNILGHKTLFPSLSWLKCHSIPFRTVVQRPGDLVVLYPGTPHFGISTGPNICEAVNVATLTWIPLGLNAKKCDCMPSSVHLDVSLLASAFRPDLWTSLVNQKIVVTQEMLQEMNQLNDAVCATSPIVRNEPVSCPAPQCPISFLVSDYPHMRDMKMALIKHVKSCHAPLLRSENLLARTSELFPLQMGKSFSK
ncbi:Lysine-specific demethylase 4 [Frankliniella fusca]|uniref:Lysine-specific demethylase 4 n=1 Tax=Frankliniella fusca TaxID=407009 RepID=A0AAE1HXU4_9NEOP|nr:Lysine-specific demethylase 4 [Frankliniella fusca]